ncbi:MAG: Protease HtpX [Firmicutes bacterium]|nr:Protease HtpX [candidate division NPL-UPA2 bacterium]MBT9154522.1 Protease HtpX [candidate division NPL-UPA2 bacterium]MBT9156580.1 Protease HtpX [candidate division NPL-UPA2 bacterium]
MVTWQLFVSPFVLHVFIAGGLAFALIAVLDMAVPLAPRARMTLYAAVLAVPIMSYFGYFAHIFGRCSRLFGPFAWRICTMGRIYAGFLAPFTAVLLGLYLLVRLWQYYKSPLRLSRLVASETARARVAKALADIDEEVSLRIAVYANCFPALFVRDVDAPELCVTTGLLEQLNDAELRAALAHEVAHVRGHDNVWNLVFLLKEVAFFSPLAHLAYARYCQAREEAADYAVNDTYRLELASALLKVLRRSQELVAFAKWRWSESFLVGGGDMKRRIELLLADRRVFSPVPLWAPLSVLGAIVVLIC